MKIALFSSWLPEVSEYNKNVAEGIAEYLHTRGVVLVTGGCTGIPAIAVEAMHKIGGMTVGYFPHTDRKEYIEKRHIKNAHALEYYSSTKFVTGFTARSLKMIEEVDAVIVMNGRIGTLSETGIAIEEGLPIAVIEGTGGIADELLNIMIAAKKTLPKKEVIFERDYKKAIDHLITEWQS
jgi:uncharacterized protein (TIGR00725 family)